MYYGKGNYDNYDVVVANETELRVQNATKQNKSYVCEVFFLNMTVDLKDQQE